jgi:hypothetical protein
LVVYQSKSVVSSATIVMSKEDRMMWKVSKEGSWNRRPIHDGPSLIVTGLVAT